MGDSDAYTVGQVAAGFTNGGVVTGVDYGNGLVSGYGAFGNRAGLTPSQFYNQAVYQPQVYGSSLYNPAVYSGYNGYAVPAFHSYGKRSADSEPEAYTIGQVAAGLPIANAFATGHPHNVGVVTNSFNPIHTGYTGYNTGYTAKVYGSSVYVPTYSGYGHSTYATPAYHNAL